MKDEEKEGIKRKMERDELGQTDIGEEQFPDILLCLTLWFSLGI